MNRSATYQLIFEYSPSHEFLFCELSSNDVNNREVVLCDILEVPCQHPVVVSGLCPDCGENVPTRCFNGSSARNGPVPSKDNTTYPGDYKSSLGFMMKGTEIFVKEDVRKESVGYICGRQGVMNLFSMSFYKRIL